MPNDEIRDDLIRLAALAKETKELKATLEVKEEQFKSAFVDFFNANREYVFANAVLDDVENPPFRYHDVPKKEKRITFVSCSCGDRVASCVECGDGMYSYFTVDEHAQILRFRVEK